MIPGTIIRIVAMADKEWIQIRRDTRSLILSLFAPVFLILLFGYALSIDVKHVSTVVLDHDRSAFSRRIIEKFSHTEYISVKSQVKNSKEIDNLINSGKIVMAIVIPPGFETRFKSGKEIDIQIILDGTDSTSATVASGYAKGIINSLNQEILEGELSRLGMADIRYPVRVQTRVWYNPELKSRNFIIPGLIVIIMAIISALITSLTISREWERGTMETLITTPVRGWEVIIGKLIPFLLIGIFDVVLALIIGHFVFDVPIKGSLLELTLVSVLFLTGTSGLGIMISSATRIQVLSVQFALVATYLPSLILSGYIFPISDMPFVVRTFTYLVPARYMMTVAKNITTRGVGITLLWTQIVFLFIYALVVMGIAIRRFRMVLPEK